MNAQNNVDPTNRNDDPNKPDENFEYFMDKWVSLTEPKKTVSTKAGTGVTASSAGAGDAARGSTLGEALWDTITNPSQAAKDVVELGQDAAKAAKQAAKDIAAATKKTLEEGAKKTEKILLLVAVIAFFVAQSKS